MKDDKEIGYKTIDLATTIYIYCKVNMYAYLSGAWVTLYNHKLTT